jgi:hypothetical protein
MLSIIDQLAKSKAEVCLPSLASIFGFCYLKKTLNFFMHQVSISFNKKWSPQEESNLHLQLRSL